MGRGARVTALEDVDWRGVEAALDTCGFAPLDTMLTPDDCAGLQALYQEAGRFRSRIEMARFRFGEGEYKYFAAPLPPLVQTLRVDLYARLAPIANRWAAALGARRHYPPTLDAFLAECHTAGQWLPTPLLLSYRAGGYNCLHQDIYGEIAFPLQAVFALSRAGADYAGGELLLVEQRPRAQSRGHVIGMTQGAGVVLATRERPVRGARGAYRVVMRHGVSTITHGSRMTLGIIFHDAKGRGVEG